MVNQRKLKISIITPVFNSEKTILKCIESISNQTYKNIEHIIVNKLSTDSTLDIIKEASRYQTYVISEEDCGVYDAYNKGISSATGDYLFFLGSDDYLYSNDVLELTIKMIISSKMPSVLYGNSIFVSSNSIYDGVFNKLKMLSNNICHQSIFYKREVFYQFGFYDLKYRVLADYALNLKLFNSKLDIKYFNVVVSVYNDLTGLSSNTIDYNFFNDFNEIIINYPTHVKFLFKYKSNLFIRKIFKPMYEFVSNLNS